MMKTKTAPSEFDTSQAARAMLRARWEKTTPEERQAFMREVRAQRTPERMGAAKRSDKPRCPCGAMTLKRAEARRHKCVAPEVNTVKKGRK